MYETLQNEINDALTQEAADTRAESKERARLKAKSWHERNKEKVAAKAKAKRQHLKLTDPLKLIRQTKRGKLIVKFLQEQDFECAVCGFDFTGKHGKRIVLDHDHSCCPGGKVCENCARGAICHECNAMLGFARDSIENLEKGIKYLQQRKK